MRHKNKAIYEFSNYNQSYLNNKLAKVGNMIKNNNFKNAFFILKELEEDYAYDKYYILECGIYYYELAQYENNSKQLFSKSLEYFESLTNSNKKYRAYYYIGKIYLINKNYDMAKQYFSLIAKSDNSEKDYAKVELSKIHKYQKEYDKALEYLYSIDGNSASNSFYTSYKLEIADNYICQKKFEEANEIIDSILKYKDKNYKIFFDKAYYLKAIIKYEQQKYEECRNYTLKIKKLCTKDLLLCANVEYKLDNFDEAYKYCNLINDNSNDRDVLIAKIKIKCNDLDAAYMLLENIISNNQEYLNLSYYLGVINFKKNKFEQAKKNFNVCIKNDFYNTNLSRLNLIFIGIKQNNVLSVYNNFKKLAKIGFFKEERYYYGIIISAYLSKYYNLNVKLDKSIYSVKQIIDYDPEEVRNHLLEHTVDKGNNHSIYNKNINIDELIEYAQNNLNDNTYNGNNFFDEYIIKYDNVGMSNSIIQNYIKVVTIPNTNKIITIYPYTKNKIKNDDNILNEYVPKEYNQISQVEKFCKRYNYKYKQNNRNKK